MGRSTKGKVNITSVNTNNIKEITDSDKTFIKQRGRKASEFFKDTSISSNEIYNDFIDETYCHADEGETKKDKLTRKPYRWSQWRNYGGTEVGIDETIPEIFWANIIDSSGGTPIERAPQNEEEWNILNELNLIPELVLAPSETDIINQIDGSIVNSRHLASEFQSSMFSGTRILNSKVATKVGIDYSDNTSKNIPEFEVKVTPYITDGVSKINYYKTTLDEQGIENIVLQNTIKNMAGPAFFAIFTVKTLAELWPTIQAWWYGGMGPFTPGGFIYEGLSKLLAKIYVWILDLVDLPTISAIWAFLGPILEAAGILIALVLVADVIWDFFTPEADILDAIYQYSNAVLGTYTFEDIAMSEYSYGFGRMYNQVRGKVTKLIKQVGESEIYNLDSFNGGAVWGEDNLFTKFPNQPNNVPLDYLNFDFFPKSYQYDLDTPPPIIEYLVELVPVRNCKLSATKPTAFVVRVVPDKFLAPKFEAITSVVGTKGKELYKNTSITFKNARYCDFIFLEDTTKHEPDDWSNLWGLLGDLFTDYYHIVVNTDSNSNLGNGNRFFSYYGRDITANGLILMGALTRYDGYGVPQIEYLTPYSDKYLVKFMNEATSSIIYNQYFRTEYNSDPASKLTGLRQFWNTNEFVNIASGAATCSGGTGLLYQSIPQVGTGYYTLTVECTGNVYLKTGGSGSCFEYGVYSWDAGDRTKYTNVFIDRGYDSNNVNIPDYSKIYLVDDLERIQFSSGYYKIIVKVKSSGTKDISFALEDGSSISMCKLQKLPSSPASNSTKRGSYNAVTEDNQSQQWFQWNNDYLTTKTVSFYYDWEYNHTYNMEIIIPDRTGITNVSVKWNKINTTSETIEYPFEIGVPISISYQGDNTPMFKADVIFSYGTTTYALTKTLTVTNNDPFLLDVWDTVGALEESILDFSGTKIGSTYQLTKNWNFQKHKYRLKSLDISDTLVTDSVENITSITDSIDLTNTDTTGFFSQLASIPTVTCVNTNINRYGTGQAYYPVGTTPNIVWKNSKTTIEEEQLRLLLSALDNSNTYKGTLDIAGDNPEISLETSLTHISNLIDKGWNVLYNEVTIPVITLLGNNPLTWNLGETFVDPGATALDAKDGDITENIVAISTVDINNEGTYQVAYNVADSDGNAAEEVVRSIIVDTPYTILISISSTSTLNNWSPSTIEKSGRTLKWIVTGAVEYEEIINKPVLDLSAPGTKYINIYSNDGVEGLTEITFSNKLIDSIDVSNATNLRKLDVQRNDLLSLNLLNNTNLEYLDCYLNYLTSLDLSGCSKLIHLNCGYNYLTSLNISNLPNLNYLHCGYRNTINNIDLSSNIKLEYLEMPSLLNLTSIDLTANVLLNHLTVAGDPISQLDISNNSLLTYIDCSRNNLLTTLNVSNNINLTRLHINNCSLSNIIVDNIATQIISHGLRDGLLYIYSQTTNAIMDNTLKQTLINLGWNTKSY